VEESISSSFHTALDIDSLLPMGGTGKLLWKVSPMLPSKRALTDLIGAVYDAAGDATLWDAFLGSLARTTQAESAALVVHELGRGLHTLAASWMVDPEASCLYQNHYGSIDVWAKRGRSKPAGYVCTSESLCPIEELASTQIYNDYLLRYGIVHGMFGVVENDTARRWGSVSLYRGQKSTEFRSSDLEILNFLIPHIRRAFTLYFRLSDLEARTAGTEAALNLLVAGVIFVGSMGEIILMNTKAEELVRNRDGLLLVRKRLSAAVEAEATRLHVLISSVTQTSNGTGMSAGGTIPISRRNGRSLSVTIAPLRNFSIDLVQQPTAVIFISDPDENLELPADFLTRCHGLTSAEARLAMILVEGHSLKEAADLCGVTRNTAKSQLKSIFTKTNVQRQAQMVRLILSAPPLRQISNR
jgi:DNA-binding CsgD family transcriptional regulator